MGYFYKINYLINYKIKEYLFFTIYNKRLKCHQIIMKARFSMKDDKKTLEEIEVYAKQLGIK